MCKVNEGSKNVIPLSMQGYRILSRRSLLGFCNCKSKSAVPIPFSVEDKISFFFHFGGCQEKTIYFLDRMGIVCCYNQVMSDCIGLVMLLSGGPLDFSGHLANCVPIWPS